MRHILQLAGLFLLMGTAATRAQITSPDKLVAPAPRPPQPRERPQNDDLQWLWQYAQPAPEGKKFALLQDPRFPALLKDQLKAPQAFWSTPGSPLSEAAHAFLDGAGTVAARDNRYVTITGCVVDHCDQHGLLWVDLGQRNPLVVFAGLRWNEEGKIPGQPDSPFTLWLFPTRELDAHQLPSALQLALSAWTACSQHQIANVVVVDPNGVPHVIGSIEAGVQPTVCTKPTGTHS